MKRRALVLGSQIEGLRGVENDSRAMAAMLDARGFAVDLRVGAAATRAGMLAGYDQLIAASDSGDAAVVYYCGHGYHAMVAEEGRSWQCIAPTDLRDGSVTDWRGITAWELSIKQTELTARTRNVTVILDCCHSAQLSRSEAAAGVLARTLPHPVDLGFDHHLAALRATYGLAFDAVDSLGNAHAVRVVACGQSQAAFELPDAAGNHHGVFTEELLGVLAQVGGVPVSWAAIIGAVRARVLRRFVRQRPDVEGPARRGLFTLAEHDEPHGVPLIAAGDNFRLPVGALTGAAVGDVYRVVAVGAPLVGDAFTLPELEITHALATTATARRTTLGHPIPGDSLAVPLRRSAPTWAVAIDAPSTDRTAVEAAIAAAPTLRAAIPGELGALATIRVADGAVTIDDAGGPLHTPLRFPSELDGILAHLANLGVAQGVRELEGEHGVLAGELAIELGVVRDGRPQRLPDHGAVLGLSDRYYLSIERRGPRTLFAHALMISARGKIVLLSHFDRGGIALGRHNPSVMIGQRPDGTIRGVGLRWPDCLPRIGLRLTELFVIATPMVSDLSGLETRDPVGMRSGGTQLQRILAQLCDGSYRGATSAGALDGFFVKRLSILLAADEPHTEYLPRGRI